MFLLIQSRSTAMSKHYSATLNSHFKINLHQRMGFSMKCEISLK
ncbi:conserved hypothetical protein [delta proteobacterium NaphS2]|nr:conserved hypothetical protein [delta proteobacterium NaphS2]